MSQRKSHFQRGTTELIGKFENSLNNFIEAISVMLITACVIPLVTFMSLIWLIKTILQIDIPSVSDMAKKTRIDPNKLTHEELMHTGNPTIRDDQIKTKMPISLYHAYREYQYGIYAYGDPDGNVIENQLDR